VTLFFLPEFCRKMEKNRYVEHSLNGIYEKVFHTVKIINIIQVPVRNNILLSGINSENGDQ